MSWLAVALGGAFGAMARYALATGFASHSAKFPVATWLANVVGSFAMACLYVLIVEKSLLPEVWRHALMVGFFGAFTTFSTFSIEVLLLLQRGEWLIGLAYVGLSFVVCLLAAWAGVQLTQALLRC